MTFDAAREWLREQSSGFEFDYSNPVEWILVAAYVVLAAGNWKPSDGSDAPLRRHHLVANLIFVVAGWMAGLWSMILANTLLLAIQLLRLVTGYRSKRRVRSAQPQPPDGLEPAVRSARRPD